MSTNDQTRDTRSERSADNSARRAVREAFAALPLDQRLVALVEVELDLLGDAAQSFMNAASKAADEVVNAFCGPEPSGQSDSRAQSS
jgi:hypothetical protein